MANRIFVVDGREHQDPDPKMTPDEVRQYMASFMPELANAEVIKSERDSKANPGEKEEVYELKRRTGTKGI